MMTKILALFTICSFLISGSAVKMEDLLLTGKELPAGYTQATENNCISIQACSLYENPEVYEMLIGKVRNKQIQSFVGKKDNGAVMYFEFENDFTAEGFLGGLLWGGSGPTKEHPEEFYAKGKFLVIWSFKKGSPLAKASQEKVKAALN